MDNNFSAIWERIEKNAGRVFLTESGKEFHYEIEEDRLRLSCRKEMIAKNIIKDALQAMPCSDYKSIPKHCTPRGFVWTLLNDTRIYQRERFAEYEKNEYWERRKV